MKDLAHAVDMHRGLIPAAERAKSILSEYKAPFTKEEFLAHQARLYTEGERIDYRADGTTVIRID
ncbi:MAG: hypothetical protein IJW71_05630 [Clostridia bacterium]|nr:hypothetical protein [Clostridia bacterium]